MPGATLELSGRLVRQLWNLTPKEATLISRLGLDLVQSRDVIDVSEFTLELQSLANKAPIYRQERESGA